MTNFFLKSGVQIHGPTSLTELKSSNVSIRPAGYPLHCTAEYLCAARTPHLTTHNIATTWSSSIHSNLSIGSRHVANHTATKHALTWLRQACTLIDNDVQALTPFVSSVISGQMIMGGANCAVSIWISIRFGWSFLCTGSGPPDMNACIIACTDALKAGDVDAVLAYGPFVQV